MIFTPFILFLLLFVAVLIVWGIIDIIKILEKIEKKIDTKPIKWYGGNEVKDWSHCECTVPIKKYSESGCHACWTCKKCGKFGGCDNLAINFGD
jgi:hypothetical protein